MKDFRFLLFLTLLAACRPSTPADTTTEEPAPASFTVPFSGQWLSQRYYESVLDKGSPRAAQELVETSYIRIPATSDAMTQMSYGFHETGPDLKVVKNDSMYTLWEIRDDSLYRAVFPVTIVDSTHIKLGDEPFVKIVSQQDDHQPMILESILFQGTYTADKGQTVSFGANGEVTGLAPYTYYHVLTDYMDAGLQVDQVGLGETKDSLKYFAFTHKNGKLELFDLKCLTFDETEKRCVDVDFGKKKFSFSKK